LIKSKEGFERICQWHIPPLAPERPRAFGVV
jgi:hypothetical protein